MSNHHSFAHTAISHCLLRNPHQTTQTTAITTRCIEWFGKRCRSTISNSRSAT